MGVVFESFIVIVASGFVNCISAFVFGARIWCLEKYALDPVVALTFGFIVGIFIFGLCFER